MASDFDGRPRHSQLPEVTSNWLAASLRPHGDTLHAWFFASGVWFLGGGLLFRKVGLLGDAYDVRHTTRNGVISALLILPSLLTMTLCLLADLSVGHFTSRTDLTEDQLKAQIAFAHSMLVACAGVWMFSVTVLVLSLLRWVGVLPALKDELARAQRAAN